MIRHLTRAAVALILLALPAAAEIKSMASKTLLRAKEESND